MITLLLIAIAAILNAVMDILENENFFSSVFAKRDPAFWYKRESWKTARQIFGYKLDAWHLAKSAMIIVLALAILVYRPVTLYWIMDLLLIGLVWNVAFNTAYKIFKRK